HRPATAARFNNRRVEANILNLTSLIQNLRAYPHLGLACSQLVFFGQASVHNSHFLTSGQRLSAIAPATTTTAAPSSAVSSLLRPYVMAPNGKKEVPADLVHRGAASGHRTP